MNTWIVFLRGIGGKYTLPKTDFIACLEHAGAQDITTYIATGNAVFRHRASNREALAKKIRTAIKDARGFEPEALLLEPEELAAAIAANPYPDAEDEPATLHLSFLSETPAQADLDKLRSLQASGERFLLKDGVFYLHAPDGVGRSKLFARIEKSMGVWCTARNWRSVRKVMAIADEKQ